MRLGPVVHHPLRIGRGPSVRAAQHRFQDPRSRPPCPSPLWPTWSCANPRWPRRWRTPSRGVTTLDLTGPAALRPFVVRGLVDAGRTVLVGHRHRARGRGPGRGARRPARPGSGRATTRLGDAAARAAEPAQRHRRPPARRAASAGAPRDDGHQRPAPGGRRAGALGAAAAGQGAGRPRAGRARRPGRGRARGRRAPARGRGVLPGRPGRAARRVRGPGRHRRRLPADRGAPAAGGVLGRRGRGDPRVRRRRPAHPRDRSSGCGRRRAASCCSPTTYAAARPSWARQHPQLREITDKIAEGIAVEGMESLAPGAGRRDGAARRPAARRDPRAGARPRAGPHAGPRPGRDQRGVPRRQLGGRGRRRPGADRPGRGVATARSATSARHVLDARPGVVERQPVRDRRRRGRPSRRTSRVDRPSVAPLGAQPAEAYRGDIERGGRRHPRQLRGRRPRRRRAPGPRPGPADGRGARASTTSPARLVEDGRRPAADGVGHGDQRLPRPRLRRTTPAGWSCSPARTSPGQKATTRDMRKMPARRKKQIDPLELKAGDYVVHEQHGVGRFVEMKQREVRGRDPRVPRPGVRRLQARRPAGPALRARRRARPGDPLRRRRAAQPRPARRRATGPSARAAPARRCARSRPS